MSFMSLLHELHEEESADSAYLTIYSSAVLVPASTASTSSAAVFELTVGSLSFIGWRTERVSILR